MQLNNELRHSSFYSYPIPAARRGSTNRGAAARRLVRFFSRAAYSQSLVSRQSLSLLLVVICIRPRDEVLCALGDLPVRPCARGGAREDCAQMEETGSSLNPIHGSNN